MQAGPVICLLGILAAPATIIAADGNTPDQDFFSDSPIILTASRLSKPLLESPASVSVIDRHMIEASGAREVADLLRLVPGFVVGFHSGHAPVVTYHGLGQEFGRQLQVLVDGRSVFIPSFGGVPWSNLPLLLEDIERIEVIRGPNAVTYGANAFLATVNIITRHAAEDFGRRYSVRASDNANPDIKDAYFRIGNQHDDLDWRLSLGTINDEGFAGVNDSRQVDKFNFRVDLQPRRNQFWTLQFGSSDSSAGRGATQTPDNPTDIERDEEATNGYANIQWEGVWDSSTTIARLTYTRQDVTDNYDPGPFTLLLDSGPLAGVTTFIDFDRTSVRTDIELIHSDDIDPGLRLVYGGGLRQDRVKSLFLLNRQDYREVDTARLFGGAEWRPGDNWLLDVGVMLEDSSLTSLESSPRVSVIRKFGQHHALRFVASSARRNPILWEHDGETEFVAEVPLFGTVIVPTWQGNDEVDPEKIESYEIGLRSRINARLHSDVKLFSYEITDQIVEIGVPVDSGPVLGIIDVGTAANRANTEVRGIEFEFDYTPDVRTGIRAGLSLVDAESSFDDFDESFPDYTAFASASYRPGFGHEISAAYYYMDEISWLDSQDDIEPSRRLDLRYAYRWRAALGLEIIAQNLLDEYEDYEKENRHDQVVFLRLSGGF